MHQYKMLIMFSNSHRWWDIFFKKGYGHIAFVVKQDKLNVCLEGLDSGAWTRFFENEETQKLIDRSHAVVEIEYTLPVRQKLFSWLTFRWGLFSCTLLPAYVLGVSSFPLTPFKFYKKLTKPTTIKKNPHLKSIKITKKGAK